MRQHASILAGLEALLASAPALAMTPQMPSYNGLAATPSMGWDNWNAFGCSVSADLLLGTAKLIVKYGLRDLGYKYVVLDDCWSDGRYANGSLKPDFTKFPDGMKAVADNLHDLDLKFGMYSSAGALTCARYPGSLDMEKQDATSFASWGVDYLKYDNCFNLGRAGTQKLSFDRYKVMSDALNATGRPIVYSLCNWGEDSPWNWGPTISNSFRATGDVYDSFSRPDARCPCTGDEAFDCILPGFHCSLLNIMNKVAAYVSKTQPGFVADMDGLEVGNGGMDDEEYKTQFSIWSLNSSPLLMGNDIRKMDAQTLSILSNPAVIALNQDPSSSSASRVWRYYVADKDEYDQGEIALWVRQLNNSDIAVALVNGGNNTREMNATLADIFVDAGGAKSDQAQMGWDVYDLWANRMSNDTANMILNGTAPGIEKNSTDRYNATAMSYADGLKANATALMGKKIGSIDPLGTLKATVQRHGTGLFRLRMNGKGMSKHTEL